MITGVGMAAQHGGQVGEIHYGITEPLRTKGMKAQRRNDLYFTLHENGKESSRQHEIQANYRTAGKCVVDDDWRDSSFLLNSTSK